MLHKKQVTAMLAIGAIFASGCATTGGELSVAAQNQATATGVPIGQTELGAPTKPSVEYLRIKTDRSIFLDPPEVDDPAVYVRVRDSSGRGWEDLQGAVIARVEAAGFAVTRNASKAIYVLNANILIAQEVSAFELAALDETEYGQDTSRIVKTAAAGALVGGLAGATLEDTQTALAGAAAGALAGGILSSIDDKQRQKRIAAKQQTKFYSVIVDVELRERIKSGEVRRQGSQSLDFSSTQLAGSSESIRGGESETFTETSEWKRHRTRILGKAKGKLIAFEDVQADFVEQLARSIAGAF